MLDVSEEQVAISTRGIDRHGNEAKKKASVQRWSVEKISRRKTLLQARQVAALFAEGVAGELNQTSYHFLKAEAGRFPHLREA
jgi:hypothetical protein